MTPRLWICDWVIPKDILIIAPYPLQFTSVIWISGRIHYLKSKDSLLEERNDDFHDYFINNLVNSIDKIYSECSDWGMISFCFIHLKICFSLPTLLFILHRLCFLLMYHLHYTYRLMFTFVKIGLTFTFIQNRIAFPFFKSN